VTKKKDLSEFYFSINKNIALGAGTEGSSKPAKQNTTQDDSQEDVARLVTKDTPVKVSAAQLDDQISSKAETNTEGENAPSVDESKASLVEGEPSAKDKPKVVQAEEQKLNTERFKRSGDDLSSLREKFLARKRAKEQL
jgi:coiled-coil domain-containing protein 55